MTLDVFVGGKRTLTSPTEICGCSEEVMGQHLAGIGGSVVEFSPATREARVRFPANAATDPIGRELSRLDDT